jgi:DNA-binding CsgD family transcriptional regulator
MPKKSAEDLLTAKEQQIVVAMTEGLSYKLIADRLSISIDGVRFHIKNIYRKLQVNSKAEVIGKFHKGEL